MNLISILLATLLNVVPVGPAFMKQVIARDSILVADQIEYGFQLDSVLTGTMLGLPDFSKVSNDTLTLVRDWQIDTLIGGKSIPSGKAANLLRRSKAIRHGIRASIVLAPFEPGVYELPDLLVGRMSGNTIDTLFFDGCEIEVKTMPVDTATFEIHDIKGQIRYPLKASEVFPWIGVTWLIAAIITATICLVRLRRRKESGVEVRKDPAYIVALRQLDRYRGDKYWAPDKQKIFYSGITDALKAYIDDRFGVDAPEMTTAELFAALKTDKDITPEMYTELKALFERADFIKFAKFTASDEENAAALPLAVRFVTTTYQTQIEEENSGEEAAGK